jgi:transposase
MTNRNYKDNIEKVLRERIEHGDSMHDIAMSLDVNKATVSRWAKKYNIKAINKFPRGFK